MNQLIVSQDDATVVGLQDRAYLIRNNTALIVELQPKVEPKQEDSDDKTSQDSAKESGEENLETPAKEDDLNQVHAVSVLNKDSTFFCAVARGNKTLAIYKIPEQRASEEAVLPTLVYKTPKRLSCLIFSSFPDDQGKGFPILIAGDLAGDAYAFGVESKGQRLLLGHTASMLTGLSISRDKLLTADRDEKIRISRFPNTVFIDGFLLGHEAYITSVKCTTEGLVITASGDRTIRLWKIDTFGEENLLSFEDNSGETDKSLIPVDMSLSSDESLLAVTFDHSSRLDVYEFVKDDENKSKLSLIDSTNCPANLLGVSFGSDKTLTVLLKDPQYAMSYKVQENRLVEQKVDAVNALRDTASKEKLVTFSSTLERDQYGQIKLKKLHETRGPSAGDEPWNRVERVDIAKAANKRHKQRHKRRKREERLAVQES